MLRISLGSLGDEYMPCSPTYIHLLLTIISLQLSASLFFLYSVLKVHLAASTSHPSAVSLPTALSRPYHRASLWLFVTPLRGPSLFPVISLASLHAAAPSASQPLLSAFHVRGCSLFPDNPFRPRPASSAAGGGLNVDRPLSPFGSSVLFLISLPFCLTAFLPPWWAQVDSNHRPHAYQACALTT